MSITDADRSVEKTGDGAGKACKSKTVVAQIEIADQIRIEIFNDKTAGGNTVATPPP